MLQIHKIKLAKLILFIVPLLAYSPAYAIRLSCCTSKPKVTVPSASARVESDPVVSTPSVSAQASAAPAVSAPQISVPNQEMKCTSSYRGRKLIKSVAFSPDAKKILIGTLEKVAKLIDTESRTIINLTGHTGSINSVAISPDGSKAVTASEDSTAIVRNLETGEIIYTLVGHTDSIESVAISSDGLKVLTGSKDSRLKVWNLGTGELIGTLSARMGEKRLGSIKSIAISPDGSIALTAISPNVGGPYFSAVLVWDLQTGKVLSILGQNDALNAFNSVAISPDGTKALTGAYDHKLKLWDLRTGDILWSVDAGVALSIAISPDGSKALTGTLGGSAKLWDLQTGKLLGSYIQGAEGVFSVAISSDGTKALTASNDFTVRVWDFPHTFREKIFTLALSSHKRAGKNSYARILPTVVLQHIAELIIPNFKLPIKERSIPHSINTSPRLLENGEEEQTDLSNQ